MNAQSPPPFDPKALADVLRDEIAERVIELLKAEGLLHKPLDTMLLIDEVCTALGIKKGSVYKLINMGALKPVKMLSQNRFPRSQVEAIQRGEVDVSNGGDAGASQADSKTAGKAGGKSGKRGAA